ncbi:hypothetical protein NGM10_08970 [Halorussus salilacus]|nr:hypothetical protein [Halorussus salilacus]USZ66862.1 hypothetical protein NGM10_08970 [Halorussus salilacus]
MKRSVRIGLLLVVLSAFLLVAGSTGALAGECMSIGDVSTQCVCDDMCF